MEKLKFQILDGSRITFFIYFILHFSCSISDSICDILKCFALVEGTLEYYSFRRSILKVNPCR